MRFSPSYLVVNRSEESGNNSEEPSPEGRRFQLSTHSRRDEPEYNEIDVRIKVSYKTLLLAFVIFDVLRRSIDVVVDSPFIQNLLGG